MWKSRLFWKLLLAYGGLCAALVSTLLIVAGRWHETHTLEQVRRHLDSTCQVLHSRVEQRLVDGSYDGLQELIRDLGKRAGTRITLVLENGVVVADSEEDPRRMMNHKDRPELIAAAERGVGEAQRTSSTLGKPMFYLALPVRSGEQLVGFVRVAVDVEFIDMQVSAIQQVLWTLALGAGILAAPLTFFIVGRIIRPITELTASARATAAGDYSHLVSVSSRDEVGQLASVFNRMQRDLSSRVSELQEYSQRLRTILGSMVEGVVAVDADQRILLANEASKDLLEISSPDVVGRPLIEVFRNVEVQALIVEAMQTDETSEREIVLPRPSRRTLRVFGKRLPGDPCPGVVVAMHDVTELRRLETMRRDFVANVSHELKTPLSSIKAYSETLRMGAIADPEHSATFVARIEEQADRLHQLIVDLLHLARVEASSEAFETAHVRLDEVVERCIAQNRDLAAANHVRLVIETEPDSTSVWADAEGIQTVLDNLVTNAIKYTPPAGVVTVRWSRVGPVVALEVEDTGIGIAPADQKRVFERFFRVDKARSRELGGTGLGLAIVKHLVQAFGGEVRLRSELGSGSTFEVTLPTGPESAISEQLAEAGN